MNLSQVFMPTKTRTMAKKLFAIAMMMIAAISFSACTESGIADIDGEVSIDVDGGEGNPDPDYELVCEHYEFQTEKGLIKDLHYASLMDAEKAAVEEHEYTATNEVSCSKVSVKRSVAESLVGKTFIYENGFVLHENTVLAVTINLVDCETVTFKANDKTYCHPSFKKDGAIAALTSCRLSPKQLTIDAIGENSLEGTITITSDHGDIEVKIEIQIVENGELNVGTEHIRFNVNGNQILDQHLATLYKDGKAVEEHEYTATNEVNYSKVTVKRSVAEALQGTTISYSNGFVLYENIVMTASVNLVGCQTVTFNENQQTYCHPNYGVNGAIAALTSCDLTPSTLKIGYINGNILEGTIVIDGDHDDIEINIEIEIVENGELSFGTEHIRFNVNGNQILDQHLATLYKDGKAVEEHEYTATNEVNYSKVTVKRSVAEALQGTTISYSNGFVLYENIVMTASVNLVGCQTVTFNENQQTYCHPNYGVNGAIAALTSCDLTPSTLKIGYINGNILEGTIVINDDHGSVNYPVEILVENDDVLGWETDDFATVTDRNTVSINAYETRNGDRTGRIEKLTAGYSATLTAGAIITKTSQDILRLVNTTATLSSSTASFSYVLGSESFEDKWNWSASNTATFTLPDGKTQVTKPIKADYSVKSTGLNINGNVYSNAASLYADNIAVAEDVQKIQVVKADIDGYEAISGFLTTWYRNINGALVSQGNIIVVNYRNISDKNKNILVVRDASNGQEIMRENANNIAAETILSVVYGNNGMSVATLIGVTSTNNQPKDWRYEAINSNAALTVDDRCYPASSQSLHCLRNSREWRSQTG